MTLPDGLYLHLPEDEYFAQDRLGSTDMSRLYLQRQGWWWSSRLNPDHKEDVDNAAKNFGRALHKIVLEGDAAYEAAFAVAPDKANYPDLCVTVEDMRAAAKKVGAKITVGASREQAMTVMENRLPDVPVWWKIIADFEETLGGRATIMPAEDRALRIMAEAVRAHKEIGPLFQFSAEHLPLAEVTVLYTDEHGIARRARLDEMIPTVTIDVKSLGNVSGRPLKFAVGEHVVKHAYHVQMADHHIARRIAYRFIREGRIHGATEGERYWLSRFPDEARDWAYCWLFYQKPDAKKGHAPVVFPWWEDYGDELHRRGLRCLHEAVQTYRQCMAEFGPDRPWTRVEPLHVTLEGSPDRVFVPHWIGGDERLPNEEELLEQ